MKEDNYFDELLEYFQNSADSLSVEANKRGIFSNTTDIGDSRENILFTFINNHIPIRCRIIKGGFIFDSNGVKSRQIDLIVTNDSTFQFKQSEDNAKEKSFNCIEGCLAVISVKSSLNRSQLFESLDNLASVPSEKKMKYSPLITNGEQLLKQIPQRIIFAYRGDSLDSINNNLKEYYSTHHVNERSPDMIIVNNSFYIYRVGPLGVKTIRDGSFVENTYLSVGRTKNAYIGAASIFQLVSRIQTVSILSTFMIIDFDSYLSKMDECIAGRKERL